MSIFFTILSILILIFSVGWFWVNYANKNILISLIYLYEKKSRNFVFLFETQKIKVICQKNQKCENQFFYLAIISHIIFSFCFIVLCLMIIYLVRLIQKMKMYKEKIV